MRKYYHVHPLDEGPDFANSSRGMSTDAFYSLLLCAMSLIAPSAWGDAEGFHSWKVKMEEECVRQLTTKLEPWAGIARPNRIRLARVLCGEDRVFWPFAITSQPRLAPVLEENLRTRATDTPMVIGISGPSIRENSEAMHALRDLLFGYSNTLLRWSYRPHVVEEWTTRPEGGLYGGVIFVTVDDDSRGHGLQLGIARARAAFAYMTGNAMENNLLAITAREDLRHRFYDMPIQWVHFSSQTAVACEQRLED